MMKLVHSADRDPAALQAAIAGMVGEVSPERLRSYVESLAFPRHYFAQNRANRRARDLLLKLARKFGYSPVLQGEYDNIVMTSPAGGSGPLLLMGAHYDSMPETPGADDNASALALCLECARLIARHRVEDVMIVFFNREEDGLIGSREFVAHLGGHPAWRIGEAHIFEMVGYRDLSPGSQKLPAGLTVMAPDAGDFLALLANGGSNAIAEDLLALAARYIPQCPVLALKMYFGLERAIGDLNRSDHAPFWRAGIPAIMWTDTSEFRNPYYHQPSDTPETLDYGFMADVTRLALARAVSFGRKALP